MTLSLVDENKKIDNPKDIVGNTKLPLHLWPETATAAGCLALLDGALKYGRNNFRVTPIIASIYVDAAKRHINAWFEGEDNDPDSGLSHISHALACMAIIVEGQVKETLIDDRQFPTNYRKFVDELTPHVQRLIEKHANKDPKHYTIDTEI